jgi:hypothetical protein
MKRPALMQVPSITDAQRSQRQPLRVAVGGEFWRFLYSLLLIGVGS